MKKIVIEIADNSFIFKYRNNKPVPENLLNTNVISNNELVFSVDYVNNNYKIVGLFITDLARERKIDTVSFTLNEIAEQIIPLLKRIDSISKIYLKEDTNLTYSLCEKLTENKFIKEINCYSIPTFMIEILDKRGINVISRSEILFTSLMSSKLSSYI